MKRPIYQNVVDSNPMMTAVTFQSNVHPADLKTPFAAGVRERSTNSPKPMKVSNNMPSEGIHEVEPIKISSTTSLVSALNYNAGKLMSER